MKNSCLITVDTPIASLQMTQYGAAFGLYGYVHSRALRITSIKLNLKQGEFCSCPRDVFLQTAMFDPRLSETLEPGFVLGLDAGFYISAIFPNNNSIVSGLGFVEASIKWNNGVETLLNLCSASIERIEREPHLSSGSGQELVGIAMATYNPDPVLFKRQIESIRNQSHPNWLCVISDDGSDVSRLNYISQTVRGDRRFVVRENASKLGFYRNFERALAALPSQCTYVAFSDQDDIWKPDKLSQQIIEISSQKADCVYSDMEIVQTDGTIVSRTFWVNRKRPYGSLSGLLLANEATGMTMLFKSSLAELALPFPATPNLTYHDHWIALLAESRGALRYMSDPLVQYVQHGGNHTGALTPPERATDALRRALKRIAGIVVMPFAKIKDPLANRAKLGEATFWTDLEPCRLATVASHIYARRDPEQKSEAVQQMIRMTKHFGLNEVLSARISWRDRYRRAFATELLISGLLKRLIAKYISFVKHKSAELSA